MTNNRQFDLSDILEKEEIKEKILRSHKRMQRALAQSIKIGWDQMDEEQRRLLLTVGLLAQKLEKEIKETFERDKN